MTLTLLRHMLGVTSTIGYDRIVSLSKLQTSTIGVYKALAKGKILIIQ
jgi:hypothetical protein